MMNTTSTAHDIPAVPSDSEKRAIWEAMEQRKPIRVPMMLGNNPRVVHNDPDWNPQGWTFEQAFADPKIHVQIMLQHALYQRRVIGQVSDYPMELPEVWEIGQMIYNVYEAAQFGVEVQFPAGQVPCTEPIGEAAYERVQQTDIENPLNHGFLKSRLDFWHEMEKIVKDMTFEGRPVRLVPWLQVGSDGPMTVACNLVGTDFLMDMITEPEKAQRLMWRLVEAVKYRREAFWAYWGDRVRHMHAGFADDSAALIGTDTYVEHLLPLHRAIYEHGTAAQPEAPRSIHMCGDATRHFPILHEQLGVMRFDTGFPVDHGALRKKLGPDVLILGGPHIELLLNGSPDKIYDRTREILQSGVMEGGRFILREGNNLPPQVPLQNLQAMYAACQQCGRYEA